MSMECSGCGTEVNESEMGYMCCPQGHHLCGECGNVFMDMVLREPILHMPVKCSMCRTPYNPEVLSGHLGEDSRARYEAIQREMSVRSEGTLFKQCPICGALDTAASSGGEEGEPEDCPYLRCPAPTCGKKTCLVCKVEVTTVDQEEYHRVCWKLRDLKSDFDQVVEAGNTRACPHCGVKGTKDDACNHMYCEVCEKEWCYCCGEKEEDLDREDPEEICTHFADWDDNPARCPMYLVELNEMEECWPTDGDEAVDFLHHRLLRYVLFQFYEKIGPDSWRELHNHFECVRNCGVEADDFIEEGKKLFNWQEKFSLRRPLLFRR